MTGKKVDYKGLSEELESVLLALQQDDLDVDKAMTAYERGLVLVAQLDVYLKEAENTITKLQNTVTSD